VERHLACILAADVVGYSRLMEADEEATLAALNAHRRFIDDRIADHRGRVFGSAGDSVIAKFVSPVEAVCCAVEIQQELQSRNAELSQDRRMQFRVGINLGDVVVEGENLHGDGVNIAASLEKLADPGGICLSGTVYDHLAGKLDLVLDDLGERQLKNISRQVRVWRWSTEGAPLSPSRGVYPPLPDKPSIAVFPFENLTSDPDHEHFADGMAEDIITALAKFRWLLVIARHSSFAYKGKSVGAHKVAKELGVRYVVEGSVRRDGDRIRVSGQLIDANTGVHIWAERYDRDIEEIFAVQDQITESIVTAIAPEIKKEEIERARRTPPESLDAWALYQRGLALYPSSAEKDFQVALEFFGRARRTDPDFVDAIAMAALIRTRHAYFYDPDGRDELLGEADQLLQGAMRLDPRNPLCHMALAWLHYTLGEYDLAVAMASEAVKLNPNSASAHLNLGLCLFGANRYEESLKHKDTALRLSPNDPDRASMLSGRAIALFMLGSIRGVRGKRA
jgi:adenylate cyclase